MDTPFLSLCIPTFNRSESVYDCVTHILKHPGTDFEVVVSDNASADDTVEKLKSIADPRLRIVQNPRNIGLAANLAAVLNASKGEYAGVMSDQDFLLVGNLNEAMTFLRNLTRECAAVVFSKNWDRFPDTRYHPAGMEASTFIFNKKMNDISGVFYNKKVIGPIDVAPLDTSGGTGDGIHEFMPNAHILISYTKDYALCQSTLLLFDQLHLPDAYEETDELFEKLGEDYSSFLFSPDMVFLRAKKYVGIVAGMYGGGKAARNLYYQMLHYYAFDWLYTFTVALYNKNPYSYVLRYKNKAALDRFFEKYGEPWKILQDFLFRLLAHLKTTTGDPAWGDIITMLELFYAGDLDASVENIDGSARLLGGDLVYTVGSRSTDYRYLPLYLPCTRKAEFVESAQLFALVAGGDYTSALNFPSLRCKRDLFMKAEAAMLFGDYSLSRYFFERYIEKIDNAKVLSDSINGLRGYTLALWYLGYMCQGDGDVVASLKYFGKCAAVAQEFLMTQYLTKYRFSRLGYELRVGKVRKKVHKIMKKQIAATQSRFNVGIHLLRDRKAATDRVQT